MDGGLFLIFAGMLALSAGVTHAGVPRPAARLSPRKSTTPRRCPQALHAGSPRRLTGIAPSGYSPCR